MKIVVVLLFIGLLVGVSGALLMTGITVNQVIPNKSAWNSTKPVYVQGSGFAPNASVLFGTMSEPTQFRNAGSLAIDPLANPNDLLGAVNVKVTNPGPPIVSSTLLNGFTFTVGVVVTPSAPSVDPYGQVQFGASVSTPSGPASDQSVTWSTNGGAIDQNGLWTAPAIPGPNGAYTVVAASHATPAGTGIAKPTVCYPACP